MAYSPFSLTLHIGLLYFTNMAVKTILLQSGIEIQIETETERKLSARRIAILKILQRGECYGYKIWKDLKQNYGLPNVKIETVYNALKDFVSMQLVTVREIPQPGKPPRAVYDLTSKGKQYAKRANYQHELENSSEGAPFGFNMTEEGADNDEN